MFDAQGVRRALGQQAEVLNKIVDDIYRHGNIEVNRLMRADRPYAVSVFVGSFGFLLLAIIFYNVWIK